MSNKQHIFQLTTEEFIELIREVVLSVVPPINNLTDNQISNERDYLTRDEAKDLLKISYATLWKYNKEGILPATKIGSRVYYKRKDIDDAMEGGAYV
ncbi:helix-turn-helix domain-containing protein [Aestuariivivens sp. NBU2969]|uniref:helix-turn-helix domain-containing protein n=1 Tax=Aestuariivivens sp. NBU2969 TaxID=2873267 RepID=UPI001CBD1027|nr:helix-turn-helix domain-containing protein [Aestuariivivens sp. NBU2969]